MSNGVFTIDVTNYHPTPENWRAFARETRTAAFGDSQETAITNLKIKLQESFPEEIPQLNIECINDD